MVERRRKWFLAILSAIFAAQCVYRATPRLKTLWTSLVKRSCDGKAFSNDAFATPWRASAISQTANSLVRPHTRRDGKHPGRLQRGVRVAAHDLWIASPQVYDFPTERPFQVGDWHGVEQIGTASKLGGESNSTFYQLPGFVTKKEVDDILTCIEQKETFETNPDSVDGMPTYEYTPLRRGKWQDAAMQSVLEDIINSRILPYVRERFGCPTCAVSEILVRRYVPGERRNHMLHFDGHAFATAVLGLCDPSDYEGGFYIQTEAGSSSRWFPRIEPGNLLAHQFDLMHGVHVWGGVRYSLILWFKNSEQAVQKGTMPWYDNAAQEQNAYAVCALGECYELGSNDKRTNETTALALYRQSAEAGHPLGQHKLGMLYKKMASTLQRSSPKRAQYLNESMHWLEVAAQSGFVYSQRSLAAAYEDKRGIKPDQEQAIRWYRRAAEQLDIWSANRLGEIYMQGIGVPCDTVEATKWFERSAGAGFEKANRSLASLIAA